MQRKQENLLTEQEKLLFLAIKKSNSFDVGKILDHEESSLLAGNQPNIRANAQDGEGNTFCHYAAKTGKRDIIHNLLFSTIYFAHDIRNHSNQLPVSYAWNPVFQDVLSKRQANDRKREAAKKLLEDYTLSVSQLIKEEEQINGYKPGIIFTDDFRLTYNSRKNNRKNCLIADKESLNDYSIHDRQAIDEAVFANQNNLKDKNEWQETPCELKARNYLLANIGFVMGIERYVKGSIIERKFCSIPLYLSKATETDALLIVGRKTNGHTEDNLYDLLLDSSSLIKILNYFKKELNVPMTEQRKLYACIVDIHSSQDVCDGCELRTYKFEAAFPEIIAKIASQVMFEISRHFKTVVRASSSRKSSSDDYRKPVHLRQTDPDRYKDFIARENTHQQPLNLKQSGYFMLHYTSKSRDEKGAAWYTKEKLFQATFQKIPKRTLFFVGGDQEPWGNPKFPTTYEMRNDAQLPRLSKQD